MWCKSNQSNVQIWLCPNWLQLESVAPNVIQKRYIFQFWYFSCPNTLNLTVPCLYIWMYKYNIYLNSNLPQFDFIFILVWASLYSYSNLNVPKYTVLIFRFKCAPIWIDSCIGFRRASLYSHSNLTMPKCLVYIWIQMCPNLNWYLYCSSSIFVFIFKCVRVEVLPSIVSRACPVD